MTYSIRWSIICGIIAALAAPTLAQAGENYALVIGVNRYENKADFKLPDLKYADGDAVALAGALEKGGWRRDNIVLMTTKQERDQPLCPRAANVRKELKALLARCTAADTVAIAFAGYEKQTRGSDEYYLCTTDARPLDRQSMISLTELYRELDGCKAANKLVFVDACRRAESKSDAEAPKQKTPPAGVAVCFACSAGQDAFEHDDLKHGLFAYFLTQGLEGAADANSDGKVTLAELMGYAGKQVPNYARTKLKAQQTPEMLGRGETVLTVVKPSK